MVIKDDILEKIKNLVRNVPDFPEDGVHFKDISPVLKEVSYCRYITNQIVKEIGFDRKKVMNLNPSFDIVLGLDARGFIFGPQIAEKVGVGFGMIRKTGKLPPLLLTKFTTSNTRKRVPFHFLLISYYRE